MIELRCLRGAKSLLEKSSPRLSENVILSEAKNLGGEEILQSLSLAKELVRRAGRSFRMTDSHYRTAWGIKGIGLPYENSIYWWWQYGGSDAVSHSE